MHKYWEEILNDYLVAGKIDPIDLIVTHRVKIDDVAQYYRKFDKHEDGIIKLFVETKFSDPPAYVRSFVLDHYNNMTRPGAPKLTTA